MFPSALPGRIRKCIPITRFCTATPKIKCDLQKEEKRKADQI